MEWVPVIFVIFKLAVFGTGMFFAIKWHYDKERKKRKEANDLQASMEQNLQISD